jgi:Rps23 Pro-64 3,4-dihydroxylase Tpa1-like proline 4-hydroxylase
LTIKVPPQEKLEKMPTRTRSPSPEASTSKRPRIEHNLIPDAPTYFASGLLKTSNADRLGQEYRQSAPFKYCVVDQLFQDDLLRKVKDEIIKELHFTEKETDIYKVDISRPPS